MNTLAWRRPWTNPEHGAAGGAMFFLLHTLIAFLYSQLPKRQSEKIPVRWRG
ncbi:hypothetical protein [Rubinisphaera italica]|uniref:hypothetical protein n=1 Tax=Rubinisphaera italica TaxID=2527969 RepID=UPI0013EF1DCF|nr:hypothetical protein [Rubinisphaera italica]